MESKVKRMIVTTTPTVEGYSVDGYLGIVSGEAVMGANMFKDMFAGIRDIVGGRSGAYEEELRKAKEIAILEMQDNARQLGANAVLGVDLDYETVGSNGSMLMVSASGTAVRIGLSPQATMLDAMFDWRSKSSVARWISVPPCAHRTRLASPRKCRLILASAPSLTCRQAWRSVSGAAAGRRAAPPFSCLQHELRFRGWL